MSKASIKPKKSGSWGGVFVIVVVAAIIYWKFFHDDEPVVLYDEIRNGNMVLNVHGIGQFNGPVLNGYLINKTPEVKIVNTTLVKPLYLINSNPDAQNMVATRAYNSYSHFKFGNNENPYIRLRGDEHVPILLIAYCVNFGKDTPKRIDSFTAKKLPAAFLNITNNVKQYRADNENDNVIDAMQIALWAKQGVELSDMRDVLSISGKDLAIARALLQ